MEKEAAKTKLTITADVDVGAEIADAIENVKEACSTLADGWNNVKAVVVPPAEGLVIFEG